MLKRLAILNILLPVALCCAGPLSVPPQPRLPGQALEESMRHEVDRAIRRSRAWLLAQPIMIPVQTNAATCATARLFAEASNRPTVETDDWRMRIAQTLLTTQRIDNWGGYWQDGDDPSTARVATLYALLTLLML